MCAHVTCLLNARLHNDRSINRNFEPEPLPSITPSPNAEQKYARPPLRQDKTKMPQNATSSFSGSSAHHRENTAHPPKSSACPKKILAQALIISRALALMRVHCFRHLQVIQHHVLWIEIMSTSVSFLRLHFYSPQMKVVPFISSKSTSKFISFIVFLSAADRACRHKTSKFVPKLRQKHLIN